MNLKTICVCLVLFSFMCVSLLCAQSYDMKRDIAWFDDYNSALKRAEADNKMLVIAFYTSWCVYCKKLDKETFVDPRVVEQSEQYIFAKLDADIQKAAALRYRPEGFPTIVFASPSGNEIFRISGYRDADQFLTVLETLNEYGSTFAEYLTRAENDSKDLLAHETLGQIYLNIGLYEKAQLHLGKALKALPSYLKNKPEQTVLRGSSSNPGPGDGENHEARILFLISQAYLAEKDYRKASKTIKELIEKDPNSRELPAYYLELGRVYIAWGKEDKAQDAFATLTKLYPESPQAEIAKKLIK